MLTTAEPAAGDGTATGAEASSVAPCSAEVLVRSSLRDGRS
ncbi:Uncharacterised protein [Mycobacteroides abscessus]|nr:Uncharacterised protein [Mycobacteroides abscessus]